MWDEIKNKKIMDKTVGFIILHFEKLKNLSIGFELDENLHPTHPLRKY